MPKKKAVPEPAPELEMEPVPAAETVEDPSAVETGMAEDAAALPDGDPAAAPMEEGAPKPDDSAPVPEDPSADGQDMALEQESGGAMEPDAGDGRRRRSSAWSRDPLRIPQTGPAGLCPCRRIWPACPGRTPPGRPLRTSPNGEQSPFPDPGHALDETVSGQMAFPRPRKAWRLVRRMVPTAPKSLSMERRETGRRASLPGNALVMPMAAHPGQRNTACVTMPQSRNPPPAAGRPEGHAGQPRLRKKRPGLLPRKRPWKTVLSRRQPRGNDRRSFYDLDFNALDRGLSPEQRQEWNSIYASYRGRSVLTGAIAGVDRHSVRVRDRRTGEMVRQDMYCATVIPFRVRILIPSTEMWMQGEERPDYVLRNMSGAVIDFVVTHVDREAGFAIASRRMALRARRYYFSTQPSMHRAGARVKCHVLAVGPGAAWWSAAGTTST